MIRTIRKISLCAMFALVAMAFAACSSDNDDESAVPKELIGSWIVVTINDGVNLDAVVETWYKDLTWDRRSFHNNNSELLRKGAFNITENRIHLRNTCPKGRDVIEQDFTFEIRDNVLTLTNVKTKAVTKFTRAK